MSERLCANCHHRLSFLDTNSPCGTCNINAHNNWKPFNGVTRGGVVVPSVSRIDALKIGEDSWLCLVALYDRYMELSLMMEMPKNFKDRIPNMEEFFNRMLLEGILSYNEILKQAEKELGIIK